MDFDEYEYLEKTVENPDFVKEANGDGGGRDREQREYSRGSKRRTDEDTHGYDYVRKKSRVEEEDRGDRDRGPRNSDYRSPSERRSRDTERERDREKVRPDRDRGDREREKGDRDRDREKTEKDSRERERSSRDKERERIRDKEREREKDRERERSRGKSRESDRHRDKERDREREKEREAHKEREDSHRDMDREREHSRSRERRERKEEPASAEPEADPERDQRTVFAYQISLKADERDVYEFFSRAGKVRDVRLIMDRNSRRSKGVGYIEFYDAMSVPIAIAMSGQLLLGQPVMVKPSEAEKNLVQSTASAAGGAGYTGPYSGGARRLYVGNLHFNITEDQLRQVFEPFGPVELVQLPTDPETGLCKGFGFVQYQKLEDARAAQQALNGVLELVGRPIKVSAVSDQYGMQDMGLTPGDLDDDEGGGLSLNARSRALLMQKLDRSGTATGAIGAIAPSPIAAPSPGLLGATVPGITQAVAPLVSTPVIGQALPGVTLAGIHSPGVTAPALAPAAQPFGVPSQYLQLKNMFDPKTETEPDFDLDIKDDVQDECSKFGVVKHIYVDKNSAGHVYLRFDGITAAMNAQRSLHGRWFAGKMITATFMTPLAYQTKFPESR
ncbi:hypothetical protein O6H91_05G073500 [Diphasiastrum complanatum]|uniref:Uncharacterized protein n=2 Tax=Diphasiastrum complanatum TaxID=34168 RepID=A0ACC2DPR5_DIPCM|nr:hypothetical protein O6H91_05G073500 [Diphasiastrum complanatum]